MLEEGLLHDTLQLVMHAQPPNSLFSRVAKDKHPPDVVRSVSPAGTSASQKPSLKLQLTEISLGMSNTNVVYQTTVTVPDLDRPGSGALTLVWTERFAVQDVTAEAYPQDMRASLQVEGLALSHQELPQDTRTAQNNTAPQTVQVLYSEQCSLQVGRSADVQTLHQSANGPYSFTAPTDDASSAASSASACASPAAMTAAVQLVGTCLVFHADAVLALCKAAGDVSGVMQQAKAMQQQVQLGIVPGQRLTASLPDSFTNQQQPDILPELKSDSKAKAPKLRSFPRVHVHVHVTRMQADFIVAEHITWGLSLPSVNCHLDSRALVALLQQQQFRMQQGQQTHIAHSELSSESRQGAQLTQPTEPVQASGFQPVLPDQASGVLAQQPDQASGSAEQPNQAEQLTSLRPNKANAMLAERPRLLLNEGAVTLNGKLLLFCGVLDASLDLFPSSTPSQAARPPHSGAAHIA